MSSPLDPNLLPRDPSTYKPRRPPALTTIGGLAVVFGAFGLLQGSAALGSLIGHPAGDPFTQGLREDRWAFRATIALLMTWWAWCLPLTVSGLMVLRLRPNGRPMMTGTALLGFALTIATSGYLLGILRPLVRRLHEQHPDDANLTAAAAGGVGGAVVPIVIGALVLFAVLSVMHLPSVVEAFERKGTRGK